MTDYIDIKQDPNAEHSRDPIWLLINIKTGRIKEISCGPSEAAHHSGSRVIYWNARKRKPEIPAELEGTWMFYLDYCSSQEVAESVGITLEQSMGYHAAMLELIKIRGAGAKAQHMTGFTEEQTLGIIHPAALRLRESNEAARGQTRVSAGALRDLLDKVATREADQADKREAGAGKGKKGK